MFHKKNDQSERGRDANGKKYSLDIVRQTLSLIHRLVRHTESLDHDNHVQERAEHEHNEDFFVHG